jgi:site-specific DNA-methyltransferase (adenine-specific)/site-specific DNA-methyltransferase (cytosine-N4-specific)
VRNGHKKPYRIRITGYATKPASAFQFNPANWRRHGADQREALRLMLGQVGWVQGVIENVRTGNLIDGHARIEEALRDDPESLIPFMQVDLSVAEEKAVLATLDPIAAMAEVDQAALDRIYHETIERWPQLEGLLEGLRSRYALVPDERDGAAVLASERINQWSEKWKVKPGDVWAIGPHRLLCGDCRSADQVATLIGRRRISVAVTSPPYAEQRDYDEESGFEPVAPADYVEWFAPVAANVARHLAPDGSWFVNIKPQGRDLETNLYVLDLVLAHVERWGWTFAREFCWERNGVPKQVVLRFKNQFEPVYHFARGRRWKVRPDNVDQRGDRLPSMAETHEATGHQAAFPVGLPAFFIQAFSDPGEVIFDPFVGSGSTLVAAAETRRRGFGIDLSAKYCAITLERMSSSYPDLQISKVG